MLAANDPSSIFVWCAVLIGALVAGFVAVYWVRKRLMDEPPQSASLGLSLEDLRQLRREGKLSDEEYERARARMAARMARQEKPGRGDEKAV